MRNKHYWIYSALVLCMGPSGHAQDVYNFYFQKAPGPKTVIQGGLPPAKSAESLEKELGKDQDIVIQNGEKVTPPETKAAVAAPVAGLKTEIPSASDFKDSPKWSVGAGIGLVWDGYSSKKLEEAIDGQRRYSLIAQFHYNKYLTFDAAAAFVTDASSWKAVTGSNWSDSIVPAVGATVTPIHFDFFGYETFRIGAMAGIMVPVESQKIFVGATEVRGKTRIGRPYVGFMMGANLGKSMAIELAMRSAEALSKETDAVFGTAALTYRF